MEGYPPLSCLNNIPLCICSTSFYLFIHWWALGLSSYLGCWEQCSHHHEYAIFCGNPIFIFGVYTWKWNFNCIIHLFLILRKFHTVYYSGCTSLHSHQWYMKIPIPWILPNIYLFFAFDDSHYDRAFGDISLWLSITISQSVVSIFSRVCWPFWCTLCLLFLAIFFNWTFFFVCVMKVTKFFIHFEC